MEKHLNQEQCPDKLMLHTNILRKKHLTLIKIFINFYTL
jgi:hypothetical protein